LGFAPKFSGFTPKLRGYTLKPSGFTLKLQGCTVNGFYLYGKGWITGKKLYIFIVRDAQRNSCPFQFFPPDFIGYFVREVKGFIVVQSYPLLCIPASRINNGLHFFVRYILRTKGTGQGFQFTAGHNTCAAGKFPAVKIVIFHFSLKFDGVEHFVYFILPDTDVAFGNFNA
jgi:hypothetical protein